MENTKKNLDSAETTAFKDAARRLQDDLAKRGIKLKHAHALEALTASLGAANWRTLLDKLNAPGKVTQVAEAWDESKARWTVHGIYADNNQRWGDEVFARTPLEAQIRAQMERLSDAGWITRLEVTCVIDNKTGKAADSESYPAETELLSMSECVFLVSSLAQKNLGEPPKGGVAESEEFDRNMRAVEFWLSYSDEDRKYAQRKVSGLNASLDEMLTNGEEHDDSGPALFEDSRGVVDAIDVLDALGRVIALASKDLDLFKVDETAQKTGVFQVFQCEAFLDYFGEKILLLMSGDHTEA